MLRLMSVAPQTASAVVEGLARLGLDAARLGVAQLTEDEDLALLWRRAIARTGRRTLPLEVGLALPLGAMGAVDYLAASSATVGAALTVTQQVFALVGPGVQLLLETARSGERRVAVVDQPPFPGQIESDAFILGALLGRIRQLASRPLDIPLVELSEREPGAPAAWVAQLEVPRVHFGARRATLHLRNESWFVPLRNADPRLLSMLQALVGVDFRSGDALLIAVRALAAQRLPALLDLERAAPALGLGRRTLQRKLAAKGTSLSAVVDDVRRERAEGLISSGSLTFGEVAAKVGFAEQASFTRAWLRWFGATPSRWRTAPSSPGATATSPRVGTSPPAPSARSPRR